MDKTETCFRKNISFIQESTLAGKGIIPNIQRARDAGYKIVIHFIGVESVSICKERILHRVAAGGHGIPDEDAERRYKKSFAAMREIIEQVDEVYMYDNSKMFRKIAKYVAGKCIWKCEKPPKWYEKRIKNSR